MTTATRRGAPRFRALRAALMFGLAASSPAFAREQVQIEMPAEVVVAGAALGSRAARNAFPLEFHGARLGQGKALRISLRLEPSVPTGTRISFQGRNPKGGTCGSGQLSPGTFIEVFQSSPGASSGGCDIYWTLESGGEAGRAVEARIGHRQPLGGDRSSQPGQRPRVALGHRGRSRQRSRVEPPKAAGRPPPSAGWPEMRSDRREGESTCAC
jgi:hypothetical protein